MPSPRARLTGDTRIDSIYPRDYTPEQMRQWARDLQDSYAVPPETLAQWTALPADQLGPEQQRLLEAHRVFWTSDRGISGDLRGDGLVDLSSGRHRAAYMMELGVDPIPVWVHGPDQAVDELAHRCEEELAMREQTRRLGASPSQSRAATAVRAEGHSSVPSEPMRQDADQRVQYRPLAPPLRPHRTEPFPPRGSRDRGEERSR